MEANPQTDKASASQEGKGIQRSTSTPSFLSTLAINAPLPPHFPSPTGSASQRIQTLERKLDLQKCSNRLKSTEHTLVNALLELQQLHDTLEQDFHRLEDQTEAIATGQNGSGLNTYTPHIGEAQVNLLLFDIKKVRTEISDWDAVLVNLNQQQENLKKKSNQNIK